MTCGDTCPCIPGKRHEEWPVADPSVQKLAAVRAIRDEIAARVRTLLGSLSLES